MDYGVPAQDSAEGTVLGGQRLKVTDTKAQLREPGSRVVDKLRHEIDAFGIDALVAEVRRPMPWPAPGVQNAAPDRRGPLGNDMPVFCGHRIHGAEQLNGFPPILSCCLAY